MAGRKKRAVVDVKVDGDRKELANKKFAEVIRAHDEAAFALRSLSRAIAQLRATLPAGCDVVNGRIARLIDPSARSQSVAEGSITVPVKRKRGRPRKTEHVERDLAPKDGQTKDGTPILLEVVTTTQPLASSQQVVGARSEANSMNAAHQITSKSQSKTPMNEDTITSASRKKFTGSRGRSLLRRRACVSDRKASPVARGPSGGRGDGHRGRGMRFVRMPNAIEVTLLNRFRVYYEHRRRVDPRVGQRVIAEELLELSKGGVYFYQEVIVQMLRGKAVLQVRDPRGKRAIKQWIEREQERHGELSTKKPDSRNHDDGIEETVYQAQNERKRKRK